jgi:hypothetical protein
MVDEVKRANGYPPHIAYDKVVLAFLGYWKGCFCLFF